MMISMHLLDRRLSRLTALAAIALLGTPLLNASVGTPLVVELLDGNDS